MNIFPILVLALLLSLLSLAARLISFLPIWYQHIDFWVYSIFFLFFPPFSPETLGKHLLIVLG